jgi:hypothetical protein
VQFHRHFAIVHRRALLPASTSCRRISSLGCVPFDWYSKAIEEPSGKVQRWRGQHIQTGPLAGVSELRFQDRQQLDAPSGHPVLHVIQVGAQPVPVGHEQGGRAHVGPAFRGAPFAQTQHAVLPLGYFFVKVQQVLALPFDGFGNGWVPGASRQVAEAVCFAARCCRCGCRARR